MNKKLLSIIVPVYNVQGYIHDCVDSLLAQNIDNSLYEIILINDGSKDKSGEIIDRFSKTHENIKSFHFNNSGLGATRNKGINIANGKYIAFLDSDDFVPKKAYESLLESAEFNDADIVTSPVERFEDGKYTRSGLHKKIDFTQKIGTTLEESSSLLYDTTSTNKLYNLEFLKENNLLFPENIVYEDIYFTMAAYVKANKINIIEDVTYIWRIRSGESISISQDRFNIQGYKDRLKTCFDTLSYLKENANSIIAREFEKRIVEFHIPLFFPEYNNADLIYTKEFSDITNEYLQHLDQSFILDCDYRKQTIYNAIKKSNYDLILNYSLDKVKTMKLTLDGSIIANDDYLNDDYLNKINFNKSDILKTKVIEVKAKDNNIIINALITSTLLNAIDSNFIKASLVNDKKEQEIKIYKEIDNSYNLIIPTSHIDNYSNFGHTKVKLTYSKDGLCTEKILSEPGNDKFKTTLLIKNRNYNYRVNFNFGWELLIEKQEINTIFERVQIIEQKLYIYAENIDPNAIFKLKNYREQ
ncbi:glycosyltransferase [Mammaliicoccus sciuri]|nr:glycosyltransferase [Mammaliicoccus sciuri]MDT0702584.1 glycosyltransferase [Mammaliicoccus sciuri]